MSVAYGQWNTERILSNGQNALYFEDYALAIQYFNQVIKIKPYLPEPYLKRAIAKVQLEDYQGADIDCTEAIKLNPFLPNAYYVRAFARRKLNFLSDAVADLTKSLEFSPNNFSLLINRMDARAENKDYEGAMNDLDLCLKQNPTKNGLHYEKGRLQLALKDTIGATLSFDQFLKMDSASSNGWSARAYLKMQKNDSEGAMKDYDQAIKRKSTYVGDYINRGILNVQKKNFKQALLDYNTAIKLDSKNSLVYFNRGLLRNSLGDYNNAISDFTRVLELDSANNDALLQKAFLESKLGNYRKSISDFNRIIQNYPYFIPAFIGAAEAYDAMGNKKSAFVLRQKAQAIEANKGHLKQMDKLITTTKSSQINSKISYSNKSKLFDRNTAQNVDEVESDTKYESANRGAIQNRYSDVINEVNFVLAYYTKQDEAKRTNLYYSLIDQYNKKPVPYAKVKLTNKELALTDEMIKGHFENINKVSVKIGEEVKNADLYFLRAMEFSTILDFNSAIDDLNKVISLNPNFMMAYFCRANLRYKLQEISKTKGNDSKSVLQKPLSAETLKQNKQFDLEYIISDYDKTALLCPDFSFSYYNKANLLCTQKEFKNAISNYTKSIEIDNEFAEAYFNRGLTYLFIGEQSKGLSDLSKAGELGIYSAYNLIQRFK